MASKAMESEDPIAAAADFEISCNGVLLPTSMSLASVQAFAWRKSDDMVLKFGRRGQHAAAAARLAAAGQGQGQAAASASQREGGVGSGFAGFTPEAAFTPRGAPAGGTVR